MPGEYPPREPGGSRWRGSGPRGSGMGAGRGAPPDGMRPTLQPTMRPGASSPNNVYRPYNANARPAGPRGLPDASARWDADPFGASGPGAAGTLTSAHMEAIHRKRHGFALFHDGNAGHLWRGEVASLLGEGILSVGVIIWLVYLTASPYAVLTAVVALGLPWLLISPLSASFENMSEPGRLLAWIGRARVIAALGIVAMHFLTIYPLLYLLLFVIGASGRLRQSLRVAALRTCLAPGEIELVANDLYVGASVASVVGPLLGSLLFLALGDRVILVGLGAALFFLLAGNSDGFLDALPEAQRGFLQASPDVVAPDDATREDLLRAARAADSEDDEDDENAPLTDEQRELALPEWYQQGPRNMAQAIADIRVGMGLAGGRKASATGLLALLALALVGGGLTTLEAFFLVDRLNLPALYLGIITSLEGGGLVLGAQLASMPPFSKMGARLTIIGLALTGAALAIFGVAPIALIAFVAALGMGIANALAVTGARLALRMGRDGAERRAISAAEGFLTAGASLFGALLFTAAYVGFSRVHVGSHSLFPGLPLNLLFGIAGVGLALIAFMLSVTPGLRDRDDAHDKGPVSKATAARMEAMAKVKANQPGGGLWANEGDDDEDGPASRYSRAYPAAGYDDDDERGYTGDYDAYDDDEPGDDDWDDEPPARGGPRRPAGGRPPLTPRNSRGRW